MKIRCSTMFGRCLIESNEWSPYLQLLQFDQACFFLPQFLNFVVTFILFARHLLSCSLYFVFFVCFVLYSICKMSGDRRHLAGLLRTVK